MLIKECAYVSMCVCVHTSICMREFLYGLCVCVCAYNIVCVLVCVRAYVCVNVYIVYVFVYVCICMCKCSYNMYVYDFVPMISMFCGMCIYDAICVLEREGLLFLWNTPAPVEILTSESCILYL